MFKIKIYSEDYLTVAEARTAAKEADILKHQNIDTFCSKPVKHVLFELSCRYRNENSPFLMFLNIFNYGYILGKRAERARRKKALQANT